MKLETIPSPCFVIDESKLRKNLSLIQSVAREAEIEIILAFKAFATWQVFPIFKEYIKGVTASSLQEAKLGFDKMGCQVHSYQVAYKESEWEETLLRSSHITFNSINQYNQYVDRVPEDVSIGLRVNPEYSEVATDLYNPASPSSRLGMLAKDLQQLPDRVEGIHFHVLCENNSYTLEKTLKVFEEKFNHFLPQLKWVNMGGGHLITDIDYNTDHLIQLLKAFKDKYQVEVILEPGAAFVWQTGYLVTTILDIVDNGTVKTAIIDASFTAHMPDCLEMPYKPRILGEVKGGAYTYRIGGLTCLAGDFIAGFEFERPLEIGERLVFEDMIHYTLVKTNTFNGVTHPGLGIWKEKDTFEQYY